jgi:hypothetical protein
MLTTSQTGREQMASIFGYEVRRDMIVTHAWEIWTKNGLGLDADERTHTEKLVIEAVTHTYAEDITDEDWLAAALARLGH